MSKVNYRAYLEVSNDDGTTVFYATEEILKSPDLQKRCSRKENAAEHHQAAAQGRMAGRAGASPWRRIKALTGRKVEQTFQNAPQNGHPRVTRKTEKAHWNQIAVGLGLEALNAEHESGYGTKRPFYACQRMSVHGGKAVVQPT